MVKILKISYRKKSYLEDKLQYENFYSFMKIKNILELENLINEKLKIK